MTTEFDRAALAAVQQKVSTAIVEQDARALAQLYEPDALMLPPSGEVFRGRAEIEAMVRGMLGPGVRSQRVEVDEFIVSGGLAVEVGRSFLEMVDPATGSVVVEAGNYMITHRRQADGSWLMAHDIGTAVPKDADAS
ncbi:YybH family protein [Mycobacterium sp. NPDC051198]